MKSTWSKSKPVFLAQYFVLRCAATLFQMFPLNANLVTARVLGWVWYRLMPRHRRRARENLRHALGSQLPEREIRRLTLACMQQMTMTSMEALFTPRVISEWTWPRYIRLRGLGPALDVLLRRRGTILITGHYGNWELLGFLLATLGFEIEAVMRPLDNPYINDFLESVRRKRGLNLLYKKGATERADEILESGGNIAFIADQDAGRKGIFVDFFGRPASTYKSIGLLAINHQVPVIVGCARRLSPRFDYEVCVNRIIEPEEWQGREDELRWLTQEFSRAMEEFVRQDPAQYLWVHRRWKSEPPARRSVARPQPALPATSCPGADGP